MAHKQHETAPGGELAPPGASETAAESAAPIAETVSLGPAEAAPIETGKEGRAERLRAAQEALRVVERRFQSTVDRVADGILVVDGQGHIRFTNPAGARIFGRSEEALLGSDLGVPLVSGETTQVDLHTPKGPRVAELRVADTTWEDADALLISVRDVTGRREAEERERRLLREQIARVQAEQATARARVLSEASRIMVAATDQDTILCELAKLVAATVADRCLLDVAVDPGPGRYRKIAAMRIPDGTVEVVTRSDGASGDDSLSPLGRRLHASRTTERARNPGPEWIEEASASPEDAELWRSLAAASVVVAPLATSAGPLGILAVASSAEGQALDEQDEALVADLAHRASLAIENARLLRLAEDASRAKSDFLAIISHELRTPHQVHYQATSLAGLMGRVARVVHPLAKEAGLELIVKLPGQELEVVTDAEMVRHILLHLLTNAIKFTERGTVTLEAELSGTAAVLRVRDTGRGIPPDKLDQIFEPFAQAESPHTRLVGGTGIGLNLVQNLVHLLGGELEVESRPGEGSTFTVRLPGPQTPDAADR